MTEDAVHGGDTTSRRKPLLALTLFMLLLLLVVPSICSYESPLVGVAGYETQLVTDPGYFGGPLRALQLILEMQPCTYTLHGWDEGETLYYTAVCFERERYLKYDPARQRHERIEALPPALYAAAGNREDVLDHVRASGVRPIRHEPYTRPLLLHDAGLVSRSGRYTAIITRHIYSVHDVVVLEESG